MEKEPRQVEVAPRVSENHFKLFFENSPDYCYMIPPEGNILDVNGSALKLLDYTKDELVGKSLKTIHAPELLLKMKKEKYFLKIF